MAQVPGPIEGAARQDTINVGGGRDGFGDSKVATRNQALGAAAAMRDAYQPYGGGSTQDTNTSLTMLNRAAWGKQPSQAEIAGRQAIDQSLNAQMAAAASARGGSLGQAAAMRNAQVNAGAFQQNAINSLAANRAAEMAQARSDYAQAAAAQRGQDLQLAGLQSQNEYAQRGLNQQAQMGYEQMSNQAQFQQAQTDLGVAGMNANNWQSWQNQAQIQAGEDRRLEQQLEAQREMQQQQMMMSLIGGGASMGAALMTGGGSAALQAGVGAAGAAGGGGAVPPRADGGPVKGGKPYLVGERGPELVIPKGDGQVIPAEQTVEILPLYEPPGKMLQMSPSGHAYLEARAPVHPSLVPEQTISAAPAKPSFGEAVAQRAKAPPLPAQRQMTPEEMMAYANRLQAQMQANHQASMAAGPAVKVAQ